MRNRSTMTIVRALSLLALLPLLVGCQKDLVKAPPAGQGDLLSLEAYPQIVVTEGLSNWLRFSRPIVSPTDGQRPLRVTVPVRCVYDKYPVNIQYQFEFFDDAGRATGANPGWIFKHMEPRVQTQIESNALDSRATDWRLTIRPAR